MNDPSGEFGIDRRMLLSLCFGAACSLPVFAGDVETSNRVLAPDFQVHKAGESGFFVNSYLFLSDDIATLVDAQLTREEAEHVISRIEAEGATLKNIVVTHTHPDHFEGLKWIGPAFPDAVIFSAPRSMDIIAKSASYWPRFKNRLVALSDGTHTFSGHVFDVALMPDAESIAPLVMYHGEAKLLVAGDHVLAGQHLWLAEQRAEQWMRNLGVLKDRWKIETVLPGHGPPGGPSLLQETQAYLIAFLQVVQTASSRSEALEKMLERYPSHRFVLALETSLAAYFRD